MKFYQALIIIVGIALGFLLGLTIFIFRRVPAKEDLQATVTPIYNRPMIGSTMPDLVMRLSDGTSIKLKDYRGKSIVINFFGSWCPPCKAEMPMLEQAYNQSHPQLIIFGIDEGDSQKDLDDFVRLINITFPVVIDQDKKIMQQLGVQGYPTSFFIDQDGVLQVIEIGQMSEKSFTNNLNKIGIYP